MRRAAAGLRTWRAGPADSVGRSRYARTDTERRCDYGFRASSGPGLPNPCEANRLAASAPDVVAVGATGGTTMVTLGRDGIGIMRRIAATIALSTAIAL